MSIFCITIKNKRKLYKKMYDALGKEIKIKDRVVYPVNVGTSAMLRFGVVKYVIEHSIVIIREDTHKELSIPGISVLIIKE